MLKLHRNSEQQLSSRAILKRYSNGRMTFPQSPLQFLYPLIGTVLEAPIFHAFEGMITPRY